MWKRNGLSLVLLALTVVFIVGQAVAGHHVHNQELTQHGCAPIDLWHYLATGHFVSATFENWESEFLQMGMYVLLTVTLRQRGSAESRPLDPAQEQSRVEPGPTPWPVRRGGVWKGAVRSFACNRLRAVVPVELHAACVGKLASRASRAAVAGPARTRLPAAPGQQHFWFESMQNWQSEFLAVLSLVVLTIFLRQKDSPQSKPVEAPHRQVIEPWDGIHRRPC